MLILATPVTQCLNNGDGIDGGGAPSDPLVSRLWRRDRERIRMDGPARDT